MSKLKYFVLFFYMFINQLIATPSWCLKNAESSQKGFVYKCEEVKVNGETVEYSGALTLTPRFVDSIDIACLLFFLCFMYSKL